MSKFVQIGCVCIALLTACGDSDNEDAPDAGKDAGGPGVCVLANCPTPAEGNACCRASGTCGYDPLGAGLECRPNPGDPLTNNVCVVQDCPLPTLGSACCTPSGSCGFDPLSTGVVCLGNAPVDRTDAAVPEPTCDLDECPLPAAGFSCCTAQGECGNDVWGNGICVDNPVDAGPPEPLCEVEDCPASDKGVACCTLAGVCGNDPWENGVCYPNPVNGQGVPGCELSDCPWPNVGVPCCTNNGQCGADALTNGVCAPVPDYTPPTHPSVTDECPTYADGAGFPVWGCCATVGEYGVCGTFRGNGCVLLPGTGLPTGPAPDADAGVAEPFLRCTPPAGD